MRQHRAQLETARKRHAGGQGGTVGRRAAESGSRGLLRLSVCDYFLVWGVFLGLKKGLTRYGSA